MNQKHPKLYKPRRHTFAYKLKKHLWAKLQFITVHKLDRFWFRSDYFQASKKIVLPQFMPVELSNQSADEHKYFKVTMQKIKILRA